MEESVAKVVAIHNLKPARNKFIAKQILDDNFETACVVSGNEESARRRNSSESGKCEMESAGVQNNSGSEEKNQFEEADDDPDFCDSIQKHSMSHSNSLLGGSRTHSEDDLNEFGKGAGGDFTKLGDLDFLA